MIIKIIPETDAEKAKGKEVVLEGVKEYFLCGNRQDEEGTVVDFHQWHGSYKYLIGSLHFFHEEINDQRSIESDKKRSGGMMKKAPAFIPPEKMVKYGAGQPKPFVPSEAKEIVDAELKNLEDEEAFPEDEIPERNNPNNVLQFMPKPDIVNKNGIVFTKEAVDRAIEGYKKSPFKKKKEPTAGDFDD